MPKQCISRLCVLEVFKLGTGGGMGSDKIALECLGVADAEGIYGYGLGPRALIRS